jgi:hypothetical protein
MATTTNDVQLKQLEGELDDAGIDVANGLGSHESGGSTAIYSYDNDGHIVDLPSAAQAVVDSHVAVEPVDPRIEVIENMDSLSDTDKAALIGLIIG